METTGYIIKPDGMTRREEIREYILKSGLEITESRILLLPKRVINILYSNVPKKILLIKRKYFSSEVEIGLISGKNAIDNFFLLCGTKTKPSECDPFTIRYLFGKKKPILINGIQYYLNAIHRPNKKEVAKNIKLIKSLL